jgi:nicotinate-nucleotide adenylyltransferase
MTPRLGLFGGSFDPIHFGHLIAARAIREQRNLDTVLFLPSCRPPHKKGKELAPAHHRAQMVRLAIQDEEGFAFDDFDLSRAGPCFTIDTVAHFQEIFPSAELFWFIGADSLMDLPSWHRAAELISMCSIVTASRSDQIVDWNVLERAFGPSPREKLRGGVAETPVIDISSTVVRQRVAHGRSIRFLVPEVVRGYIEKHGLYRV